MTTYFKPLLHTLPVSQQELWPELNKIADLGFVLYGGTAISLRIGHRISIDFDFFTSDKLDKSAIQKASSFMHKSKVIQDSQDSYTLLVSGNNPNEYVKVSFFGGINFGRVNEPSYTDDKIMQVASLDDLMATKVKVILQRVEAKDYIDIAAMIKIGVSLEKGLSSAKLLYGTNFQPSESLKAMVYFKGGDLETLADDTKTTLIHAVTNVSKLPAVSLLSNKLNIVLQPPIMPSKGRGR